MRPLPHSADDFAQAMRMLLPPGIAFDVQPGSNLDLLLHGLATEPALVDQARVDLLDEADPSQTIELLPDWEIAAGLPDDCAPAVQTVQQRQAALVQKITSNQVITLAYLEAAADALGFVVTPVKRHMRQYGTLYGGCFYGDTYGDSTWNFVIEIHAALTNVEERTYDSAVYGEAYASWGNTLLECVLAKLIGAGVMRFIYS